MGARCIGHGGGGRAPVVFEDGQNKSRCPPDFAHDY